MRNFAMCVEVTKVMSSLWSFNTLIPYESLPNDKHFLFELSTWFVHVQIRNEEFGKYQSSALDILLD